MTEEERKLALYCLKANSDYHSEVCEECVNYPNCDHTIQDDVTETIIKALEQEPCEDIISRQAIIDALQPYINANKDSGDLYLSGCGDGAYHALCMVKELPSVQSKPKIGHWKEVNYREYKALCSNCGTWSPIMGNYCPYCGAKMESEGV